MKAEISKTNRRFLVVLNYASLIALLSLFHVGFSTGWSVSVIIGLTASFAVTLISFIFVHIGTRLWKLIHTKIDNLDERQIYVTHESVRHSYSIFTILSLLFIMYLVFVEKGNAPVVKLAFGSLLYLAHTLPSSIMAWMEKEV